MEAVPIKQELREPFGNTQGWTTARQYLIVKIIVAISWVQFYVSSVVASSLLAYHLALAGGGSVWADSLSGY